MAQSTITVEPLDEWDDSHAAVNHPNDAFNEPQMNVGRIFGLAEGHVAFPIPIDPTLKDLVIEEVKFRFRFMQQDSGEGRTTHMALGFCEKQYPLVKPDLYDEGLWTRSDMLLIETFASNGSTDAGRSRVLGFYFASYQLPLINGGDRFLQEFHATGEDMHSLRINAARIGGTNPGHTITINIHEGIGSGSLLVKGPLLASAVYAWDSIPTSATWINANLDSPITGLSPGQILIAEFVSSYVTFSSTKYIEFLGNRPDWPDEAARDSLQFAISAEAWSLIQPRFKRPYHGLKIYRAATYPKLYATDFSDGSLKNIYAEEITRFGWLSDGTVVPPNTPGDTLPVPGQWYEVGSADLPEIATKMQEYIDDPVFEENMLIGVILTQPAYNASILAFWHNTESGSPAQMEITYSYSEDLGVGELSVCEGVEAQAMSDVLSVEAQPMSSTDSVDAHALSEVLSVDIGDDTC